MENQKILETLQSGNFDPLSGLIEDESFEVKSQPYDVESDRGRAELAKDVAGLAEQSGGLIVIGVESREAAVHLGMKS